MPRQYFSADPSKPKQTLISNYFVCSSRIQILGQNKGKKKGGSMKKMSNNNEDETVTIPFKIPCYETESDDDDFRSDSGKSQHRKWRSILSASSEDKTVARKSPSKPSPSKGIVRKRSRVRPIIETDSSSDVELVSYTVNETLSSLDVTIASGSGNPVVEKLEGRQNYHIWKFQMKMALVDYGLWNCILGNDTNTERDQRALAKMCFSVKRGCLVHLRRAKTSKEAWMNLEKAFQRSELTDMVHLKRKLYRAKYEDFSSTDAYVNGILDIVQELNELNINIDDDEIGTLLLCGLPDSQEAVINRYCTTHSAITSSEVIIMLKELRDERK